MDMNPDSSIRDKLLNGEHIPPTSVYPEYPLLCARVKFLLLTGAVKLALKL